MGFYLNVMWSLFFLGAIVFFFLDGGRFYLVKVTRNNEFNNSHKLRMIFMCKTIGEKRDHVMLQTSQGHTYHLLRLLSPDHVPNPALSSSTSLSWGPFNRQRALRKRNFVVMGFVMYTCKCCSTYSRRFSKNKC